MRLEVEVKLSPGRLARGFADMDSDGQAQFFEELHKIGEEWRAEGGLPVMQWLEIGSHMRECSCVSEDGRHVLRSMAEGLAP